MFTHVYEDGSMRLVVVVVVVVVVWGGGSVDVNVHIYICEEGLVGPNLFSPKLSPFNQVLDF